MRVDASSGAPRLVVDGKPVRAQDVLRLAGNQAAVGWCGRRREIGFEFVPTQDELQTATMHFRFGQSAGTVDLDDIRVQDLTTGEDVFAPCDFESGEAAFTRPTGRPGRRVKVTRWAESKSGRIAAATAPPDCA